MNFFYFFFCRKQNPYGPRVSNTRFFKIIFDSAEIFALKLFAYAQGAMKSFQRMDVQFCTFKNC
jgi:hypothetical protein